MHDHIEGHLKALLQALLFTRKQSQFMCDVIKEAITQHNADKIEESTHFNLCIHSSVVTLFAKQEDAL